MCVVRSALAVSLLLVSLLASSVPGAEFQRLPIVDPVTTMAVTEDGSRLIVGHQEYDKLSVIDVATAKVVATVNCPSPRHILCRGNRVIVANFGQGTISVYSTDNWRLADKVTLGEPNVNYLSAPGGRNYAGHLLATCRVDRQSQAFFHVDLRKKKAREVDRRLYISVVTVDYDGRCFFWQGEIGHSPSAPISEPLDFRAVTANRPPRALGQGAGEPAPIVYQIRSGPFWFGDKHLLRGLPPRTFKTSGKLLVPDRHLEVVYVFEDHQITCMALDGALTELGTQPVTYPADFKRMSPDRLPMAWEHRGDLHYQHVAITSGDTLRVFVLDEEAQSIFYCQTASFAVPAGLVPKGRPPAAPADASADVAAPPANEGMAAQKPSPGSEPVAETPAAGSEKPALASDDFLVSGARLQFPFGPFKITPGLEGRTLLVLCGERLAVLGPDGWTIQARQVFDKPYVEIAERAAYYVAISGKPYSIDLLDKKKAKPLKSFNFSCIEPTDLALHPTRPLSYVAMSNGADVPRYHFVVYDEKAGAGRESEGFIGTWLAVDPGGRWLIAGYRDIYERGAELLINPDRWHVVPEYGSLDWLIRYRLDRSGLPEMAEVKEKAGGNGVGLRLAPDGSRVTYLSHVGSPMFSENLAGWDPKDLTKMPVAYPVQNVATTHELAYHPFLPLVASPGADSVVVMNRDSGRVEPDRVQLDASQLSGGTIRRLLFSPDGKALVLVVEADGIFWLIKTGLRLKASELRQVEGGFNTIRVHQPTPASSSAEPIPLAEIEALRPVNVRDMSAKDIARYFSAAVVVIHSGESTATGFVVGSGGYVLTCAHAVDDPSDIVVVYRFGAESKKVSAKAKVLRLDEDNDLALLKIRPAAALTTVFLAPVEAVETGEAVTIIGNPGVSDLVLDHTLTTGVVSNPKREIDGLEYLQTSAAINPGCSGGPMFDSHGRVIGLVVLKAQIEAAGFAVPAHSLRDFLGAPAGPSSAVRMWTDSTGRFRVEATLVRCDGENVELRKADGSTLTVPRGRLSTVDQNWLQGALGQKSETAVSAKQ